MMMDEAWIRQWTDARDAAQQARKIRQAEAARTGQPVPTLWGDIRALVRDLINPPARKQANEETCDARTCQSSA